MKRLLVYLRRQFRDLLFLRVCTVIYGVPIAGLGFFGLVQFRPTEPLEWLLVLLLAGLAAWGSFMTYAAFFGSERLLLRAVEGVSDGGELIGLVLLFVVLIVALPITALLRGVRRVLW